ncbi:hypothetical protein OK016_02340 [Vibrio chagasii]|nr:hypothetical protein [Vibrio chagasii]
MLKEQTLYLMKPGLVQGQNGDGFRDKANGKRLEFDIGLYVNELDRLDPVVQDRIENTEVINNESKR